MTARHYDSTEDTRKHILLVQSYLLVFVAQLAERGRVHDLSKLESPEKEILDEWLPQLKEIKYGTPAYFDVLNAMAPGLRSHYAKNSHHPEHFINGISSMTLWDLVEMFCDWQAASVGRGNDFEQSIEASAVRFGLTRQLEQIFLNTAREIATNVG